MDYHSDLIDETFSLSDCLYLISDILQHLHSMYVQKGLRVMTNPKYFQQSICLSAYLLCPARIVFKGPQQSYVSVQQITQSYLTCQVLRPQEFYGNYSTLQIGSSFC